MLQRSMLIAPASFPLPVADRPSPLYRKPKIQRPPVRRSGHVAAQLIPKVRPHQKGLGTSAIIRTNGRCLFTVSLDRRLFSTGGRGGSWYTCCRPDQFLKLQCSCIGYFRVEQAVNRLPGGRSSLTRAAHTVFFCFGKDRCF